MVRSIIVITLFFLVPFSASAEKNEMAYELYHVLEMTAEDIANHDNSVELIRLLVSAVQDLHFNDAKIREFSYEEYRELEGRIEILEKQMRRLTK